MSLPFSFIRGESETSAVWMSAWATPAFLSAAMTRATDCELAARAAFAVTAWLTVPNAKDARSGVTFAKPVPRTVIPPDDVSADALCAPEGWNTPANAATRSEEHTSELQSRLHLVCRLLLEKKKKTTQISSSLRS